MVNLRVPGQLGHLSPSWVHGSWCSFLFRVFHRWCQPNGHQVCPKHTCSPMKFSRIKRKIGHQWNLGLLQFWVCTRYLGESNFPGTWFGHTCINNTLWDFKRCISWHSASKRTKQDRSFHEVMLRLEVNSQTCVVKQTDYKVYWLSKLFVCWPRKLELHHVDFQS